VSHTSHPASANAVRPPRRRAAASAGNGAPNIRDVARRAGVSVATVSFVLNESQRHRIRPKTQDKVLAAVKALGYSPNVSARSLAVGRSQILAAIVSDIRNPFFPEIIAAFQEAANLNDLEAIVMNTNYDAGRTRETVNRLLGLQVPGVAVLTSQIDPAIPDMLASRGIAAVYLDLGRVDQRVSNIFVDYERGVQDALEHLRALGHNRIGFIGGSPQLSSAQRRKDAFLAGTQHADDADLQARAVDSDFTVQGGYLACAKLLATFRPTAILAANDLMAIGAMHAAYDSGLRIPADLSIVGFDDIRFAQHTHPPLTTVAIPRSEIGRLAFHALWSMLAEPGTPGSELRVPASLVLRASTAPPRPGPLTGAQEAPMGR
jgi:LacI family transcriptional regulator